VVNDFYPARRRSATFLRFRVKVEESTGALSLIAESELILMRTFKGWNRFGKQVLQGVVAGLLVLGLAQAAAWGQNPSEEPQGYGGNAASAGGNWTKQTAEDRMTAKHRSRFELPADNAPNSDYQAKVVLYCTDGKLDLADFHPGTRLSRPNWPGFWGQPQMRVRVRVDDSHSEHSWNWIRGHFLAMDKGTTRELIGAHLFRVEFQTPDGPEIAEFSPSGLDLRDAANSCGLKPKKP